MSANTLPATDPASPPGWRRWARRVAVFAVLWWILTEGAAGSWLIGAPVVLLAAWLSPASWADTPLSLRGLARFLPFFAYQSVVGAADVATRALRPAMPLYPGVVRHRLRLPPGAPRVALANVVSMLAGTLSADLDGDELVIHALDARQDLHAMVIDLEPRIAAVFGLEVAAASTTEGAR